MSIQKLHLWPILECRINKHSRDSDTKRSMHATGCSVIFYATAFKTLKREFRDRFLISYLKLKNLFCQLQIKDNNRTSL